jgi:hypothetical protein
MTNNDTILKEILLNDFGKFVKYFFNEIEGYKFITGKHHDAIFDTLTKVKKGEITRLVINVPPRFSKSIIVSQFFIAWTLAEYPDSNFLHISYSETLVGANSVGVKNIIDSSSYQRLFSVKYKDDAQSKFNWKTTDDGGMYCVPSLGQVRGFGAGKMYDPKRFTGALILDDPNKGSVNDTKESYEKVNRNYMSVFKNRLALESIPVILIMQRLFQNL